MFLTVSRKKQAHNDAASSRVSGGVSRVLTAPTSGAFAITASAQVLLELATSISLTASKIPIPCEVVQQDAMLNCGSRLSLVGRFGSHTMSRLSGYLCGVN